MFDNLALIVTVGVVVLLILLFIYALGVISSGALTESVAAIDRGEERRFSSAFRAGFSSFWRVLGLSVVFFLIWAALLLVVGGPIVLLFVTTATGSVLSRAFAVFSALFIVLLVLALPAIILFAVGSGTGAIVAFVVALTIWLVLIIVALAAVSTFYHSYWTLAYLRLVAGEADPQAGSS